MNIYQFKITLSGASPKIWRIIEVPESYSFWDLHVAIQDSMGWLDYHLHEFVPETNSGKETKSIGVPDGPGDESISPGWEVNITEVFDRVGEVIIYSYDFGDGWHHSIELLKVFTAENELFYPKCIDGERACPPEDCGGTPGYQRLLEVLSSPEGADYSDMVEWLKGHEKNYHPYKPEYFDPSNVEFQNPEARWELAFSNATRH
ncbi:MAG: plasmid pRiA4b ORF-3 family protein [Ectothiorhodospiraceae bacterium]|nr:plasmid pRiA4b ORF-3 family protein [Ectothiorhodospiraceae bacterium]